MVSLDLIGSHIHLWANHPDWGVACGILIGLGIVNLQHWGLWVPSNHMAGEEREERGDGQSNVRTYKGVDAAPSILWLLLLLLSNLTGQGRGAASFLQKLGQDSWIILQSLITSWGLQVYIIETYFSGWKRFKRIVLNSITCKNTL